MGVERPLRFKTKITDVQRKVASSILSDLYSSDASISHGYPLPGPEVELVDDSVPDHTQEKRVVNEIPSIRVRSWSTKFVGNIRRSNPMAYTTFGVHL
jgi:hypothetical protein